MGTFGDRFAEAFDNAPDTEIAKRLKNKPTSATVGNYRRNIRAPDLATLAEVSELTNCSIHWLVTGKGPRYVSAARLPEGEHIVYLGGAEREIIAGLARESGREFDETVRELVIEQLKARDLLSDKVEHAEMSFFGVHDARLIPVRLWGEISAGQPIEVIEMNETVLVPEDFVARGRGRQTVALRVRGDSMEDEGIFEGDIIVCYRTSEAADGDTVIALVDGSGSTVKKLYRERGMIRLQPRSSRHKPLVLKPDRVVIQAVVRGIFRRT